MEYFLGEYIEDSVQHEVLDTATNKAENRQYRAANIRKTRFNISGRTNKFAT